MTPHRAIYHKPPAKHTTLILTTLGSACLILSGVTGLASLLGWIATLLILAAVVALGAVALVWSVIAALDTHPDIPRATE